ncbi:MAG TPA: CHASE2 domain-containing protein [Polyangia bacterium]
MLVLTYMVPFAFDHASEWIENAPPAVQKWDVSSASYWYQRVVTAGFRVPRPHYTALVVLDSTTGEEFRTGTVCDRRRVLTNLIPRLLPYEPSAIVIDQDFAPKECSDHAINKALAKAIARVTTVPIIVGANESTVAEARKDNPALVAALGARVARDPIIIEQDIFPLGPQPTRGLVRVSVDERRIPTFWTAVDLPGPGDPRSVPTISLFGALADDPFLDHTRRWKRMEHVHPYTSLIPESDFHDYSYNGSLFLAPGAVPPPAPGLRHRVVVVGKISSEDIHRGPAGEMPGFVLQANYIEALLDDRGLFPTPRWIDMVLSFLCFVAIHGLFSGGKPWKGLALSLGFFVTAAFAVHLTATLFGYYTRAWPGSLIAVALKFFESITSNKGDVETN